MSSDAVLLLAVGKMTARTGKRGRLLTKMRQPPLYPSRV
jgi:hypothetical protein